MGFSLDAQALRLQTLYFSKMIMETYNRDIQFIIDPGNKNKWILISFLSIFWFGLAGGGALPSNRLIGMCCWMGWHFYDWIDYKGVVFSIELLEWGAHCQDFGGKNVPVIRDFKP